MFLTLFATIIPFFARIALVSLLTAFEIDFPTSVSVVARAITGNLLPILVILDLFFIMLNRDVREIISEIKLVKYFCHSAAN